MVETDAVPVESRPGDSIGGLSRGTRMKRLDNR